MSTEGFIIAQPAGQRTLALRESYLQICGGDACEAHLLNAQERWYAYKLKARTQAQGHNRAARQGGAAQNSDEALWVRMGAEQWAAELLGIYHEKTIRLKLASLVGRGFVSTRPNPSRGWDRTPQWLFARAAVQGAVDQWAQERPVPDLDPSAADGEQPPVEPGVTALSGSTRTIVRVEPEQAGETRETLSQSNPDNGGESSRTIVRLESEEVPDGAGQISESIRTNVRSNNTGILHIDSGSCAPTSSPLPGSKRKSLFGK